MKLSVHTLVSCGCSLVSILYQVLPVASSMDILFYLHRILQTCPAYFIYFSVLNSLQSIYESPAQLSTNSVAGCVCGFWLVVEACKDSRVHSHFKGNSRTYLWVFIGLNYFYSTVRAQRYNNMQLLPIKNPECRLISNTKMVLFVNFMCTCAISFSKKYWQAFLSTYQYTLFLDHSNHHKVIS